MGIPVTSTILLKAHKLVCHLESIQKLLKFSGTVQAMTSTLGESHALLADAVSPLDAQDEQIVRAFFDGCKAVIPGVLVDSGRTLQRSPTSRVPGPWLEPVSTTPVDADTVDPALYLPALFLPDLSEFPV